MTSGVNPDPPPGRRYDSSRRTAHARQNRAAVLQAARRRFLDRGYAGTTLAEVAADAGVSVETVYKTFSSKAGLLKALFDTSVAGDDEATPMEDRDLIRGIVEEPDARRKVERYFDHLAVAMPRSAPIQLLARDAAAADTAAADVWREIRQETLAAMTMFGRNLADTGRLKVSAKEARDVLWTYHAPELYELLVIERGWSAKRYARFAATAVIAALVTT